jgi:HAD superfamily hydrolase (TIGR01549 family)
MRESLSDPADVKAVIFDVDGTLADSWRLGYDATVVVLKNNNVPEITEEIYHECTRYATPERLARHAGRVPGDTDFEQVGQTLGDQFDNLYVGLVTTTTAGFYDGIAKLLEGIPEDVKIGALTNACVRYAEAVLEVNGGVGSRFGSIRGADNVPTPKPAPDGLFVVCNDLGVDPKDCVYIGDSPSDIFAAKNAGMIAIGVLWGSHPEESLRRAPFDHMCKTVEELKALLPIKVSVA